MPRFSKASLAQLETCDPRLQEIMHEAIKVVDFKVTQGHRSVAEQKRLFAQGRTAPGSIVTKVDGVEKKSKHNYKPSKAVDFVPYPVDWSSREKFAYIAGVMMGIAKAKGIPLRWGGDFNRNSNLDDDQWDDAPHVEIDE